MINIEEKFKLISELEPNWDSDGGFPIGEGALQTAKIVAKVLQAITTQPPAIIPTSMGGVALEWYVKKEQSGSEFMLTFNSNGGLESFYVFDSETKVDYEYYSVPGSVSQSVEETDSKPV